ncbi:MAG: hypothetical protein HP496_16170 [Nitrospira sp.]|nr:hypothetical protein [Nitrospira sp.]
MIGTTPRYPCDLHRRNIDGSDEWDEDVREYANFHCYHVLEQPPAGWSQGTGRITEAMLHEHLPPPGSDTVIFLCGPPPMARWKRLSK